MASRSKKKTTMAKLTRESRLRERRVEKQAKKDARKQASAERQVQPGEDPELERDHGALGGAAPGGLQHT